jgi:hypothetical protein
MARVKTRAFVAFIAPSLQQRAVAIVRPSVISGSNQRRRIKHEDS